MKILGIDPGYGIIGFGLVEGNRNQFQLLRCGAITTPQVWIFPPVWRSSMKI